MQTVYNMANLLTQTKTKRIYRLEAAEYCQVMQNNLDKDSFNKLQTITLVLLVT